MVKEPGTGVSREGLRAVRLLWGLFVYAIGIVLTVHANLGLSPWDVFHQGLALRLGLSFGMASVAVAVAIVAAVALMREHIGLGTLCNMILIGSFVDVLMFGRWVPEAHSFFSGLLMMTGGLFAIAIASFFYMGAGYGAGPRDSLMVVLSRRTGRPVGFCRCIVEGTALLCGWILGGRAGWGTVIAAFGIGIAVQIVFTLLRFNVRTLHQESLLESWARLKDFYRTARAK
ncbi:MAG: hypothetical protein LBR61_03835 [Synergistaceae bacterium]|jgi:uncharacterized membrane protein YczE|nr:hypothetical protein [Synergistaceae bacterium]